MKRYDQSKKEVESQTDAENLKEKLLGKNESLFSITFHSVYVYNSLQYKRVWRKKEKIGRRRE